MKMNDMKNTMLRILSGTDKAMSTDKLLATMHVKRSERARALILLKQLETSGELVRSKSGKYSASNTANGIQGRMLSLSTGFAFARMTDGADCFIPGRYMHGALPGDTVLLKLGDHDERGPNGMVVRILEEGNRLYVGRLGADENGRYFVTPDTSIRYTLPVRKSTVGGAKTSGYTAGEKVRFSAAWNQNEELVASVVTSYGSADSARVCADAIIDSAGIPNEFPEQVIEQAEKLERGGISEEEIKNREDFRDWLVMTIDGADAKDLDDAVSLDQTEDGWRLGVHIADVSHYVGHGSPLDQEAILRGTSVYFADRVIPMLPEALSNGICSLNAGEDKLTLSAIMTFDDKGVYKKSRIVKSVIHSKVRGVYSEVNDLLQNTATDAIKEKYAPVNEMLTNMHRLAKQLEQAANQRGTMDLISSEAQFVLDEQGAPAAIFPRVTGETERLIEQFMIAANVAVATFGRGMKLPFIYRVHEHPDETKLGSLMETAKLLGLKTILHHEDKSQLALRALMEEARETPYARLVSDRLLRSMAKAKYKENPLGHYGLALEDYCHFTSPIRRYPDLAIHRILSDYLANISVEHLTDRYSTFVRNAADTSSSCEMRAMAAERDCEACYKAEYMSGYLGQKFSGIISSVTDFGLYVELPNTVEGMIRFESLPDQELHFDGVAAYVDDHGRQKYTVGDAMDILVSSCDVSTGHIDFLPADLNVTIA